MNRHVLDYELITRNALTELSANWGHQSYDQKSKMLSKLECFLEIVDLIDHLGTESTGGFELKHIDSLLKEILINPIEPSDKNRIIRMVKLFHDLHKSPEALYESQ